MFIEISIFFFLTERRAMAITLRIKARYRVNSDATKGGGVESLTLILSHLSLFLLPTLILCVYVLPFYKKKNVKREKITLKGT